MPKPTDGYKIVEDRGPGVFSHCCGAPVVWCENFNWLQGSGGAWVCEDCYHAVGHDGSGAYSPEKRGGHHA